MTVSDQGGPYGSANVGESPAIGMRLHTNRGCGIPGYGEGIGPIEKATCGAVCSGRRMGASIMKIVACIEKKTGKIVLKCATFLTK